MTEEALLEWQFKVNIAHIGDFIVSREIETEELKNMP